MTRQEALALYNLQDNEDLAEQLEFLFFEYKQKIYRQLDQVLLYSKWINVLKNISKTAQTLQLPFEYQQAELLVYTNFQTNETLIDQFNRLQQLKAKAAYLLYNCKGPQNAWELLETYQQILSSSFAFWSEAKGFNEPVKLSQQFDPISILAALKSVEKQGVCYLTELQQHHTPSTLMEWISWNKALDAKLRGH